MNVLFIAGTYDVVVIGAGHAGCEASLAAARMGAKTLLTTLSLDNIAMMPCNPSIGGPAKGHLIREIDALGGEMGINGDRASIQMRMLNTSKGPAVHALRSQSDKNIYHVEMKKVIENQENLDTKQVLIEEILVEDGKVVGVKAETSEVFSCKTVIIATGTYLRGKIIIGETMYSGGPSGQRSAENLSASMKEIGVKLMRFKTGTPARVNKRSLDFSKMTIQPGDTEVNHFSFMTKDNALEQVPCWLSYTNPKTHEIIRANFHRAPMFTGVVEGIGPRYCPSIEDKLFRFADKEAHQLFVEPEGLDTNEMYVQGMSTSLPIDVQYAFLRTIKGLENVEIMRPAYAIEYDCVDPTQLKPSLEFKEIEGLFSAGQANGTSGYEEAAAQGLMAGINAALKIRREKPLILTRAEAYIGVLIDDLVTKGTNEPYRLMTSRAEYRLVLRQDNADMRLTEKGRQIGLVKDDRYALFMKKKQEIIENMELLQNTIITPTKEIQEKLKQIGSSEIHTGTSLYDLLKRTEITYTSLQEAFELPEIMPESSKQLEILAKYEGYIKKQREQIEKVLKLEEKLLPQEIDYNKIDGLALEARQKLNKIKPLSVGQASRISGISPADISVLLVYLEQERRKGEA